MTESRVRPSHIRRILDSPAACLHAGLWHLPSGILLLLVGANGRLINHTRPIVTVRHRKRFFSCSKCTEIDTGSTQRRSRLHQAAYGVHRPLGSFERALEAMTGMRINGKPQQRQKHGNITIMLYDTILLLGVFSSTKKLSFKRVTENARKDNATKLNEHVVTLR